MHTFLQNIGNNIQKLFVPLGHAYLTLPILKPVKNDILHCLIKPILQVCNFQGGTSPDWLLGFEKSEQ